MLRKRWLITVATIAVAMAVAAPGIAQPPQDPPTKGKGKPGGQRGERRGPGERGRVGDVRRVWAKLVKLQELMHDRLELSEEQTEAIDELFDDYRENTSKEAKEAVDTEKRDEAKRKMAEARESGDREAVRQLREELANERSARGERIRTVVGTLLKELVKHLEGEEVTTFRGFVRELRINAPDRRGADPRRALMRAVFHPDLALSEVQMTKIRDIMRALVGNRGAAPTAPNAEALAELKEKIFAELTEEQRTKAEAVIAETKNRPHRLGPGERRGPHRPDDD